MTLAVFSGGDVDVRMARERTSVYIGLTGNPGSGKSAALDGFAKLGWLALDADLICAEVYAENAGGICDRIRTRWGDGAIARDGRPHRSRIAGIVFARPDERTWLEEQVHPLIRQCAGARAAAAMAAGVPVAFAVPLLFEAGWRSDFTAVAAVWTRDDLRRRRLRRRGWSRNEIRRRDAAQWPADRKLAAADIGLINHGRREGLWRQCRELSIELAATQEMK